MSRNRPRYCSQGKGMDMIGIDIRFMTRDMQDGIISSGVGLFCAEVLSGMKETDRKGIVLIVNADQRKTAGKLFGEYNVIEFNPLNRGKYRKDLREIDERRYDRFLKMHRIRCLWIPFANPHHFYTVSIPVISTIHDLITIRNDPDNLTWKRAFQNIIEKSRNIITVSDYVRKDILREFESTDPNKITVIPCPVVVGDETEEVNELKERDYILDVNAFLKRKNAVTLLRAYALSGLSSRCDLVFCGGYYREDVLEELKEAAAELGLEEKVHIYLAVSIRKRNWLLKHAVMLVSPSLSEGFGRSPVEAAICKIPVITSISDSLTEATLGMVHYYREAENAEQLSTVLTELYDNPPAEEELQRISAAMKERYDPERIAAAYMSLFRQYDAGE